MIRFYFFILLLLPVAVIGQNLNDSKISTKNFCDTIPFEYISGKIIVNVAINNQQKRFIFDTGAPCLISQKLMHSFNIPAISTGDITDVTGKTLKQQIVNVPTIKLGHIEFTDAVAIVFDHQRFGLLECFDFDGFIGGALLKHCIVQIDLAQKIIILTDSEANLDLTGASKSRIKLDRHSRPFVQLDFGNAGTISALFDSGSHNFLPLCSDSYEKLNAKGAAHVLNEGYGSISSGLFGPGKQGVENRVEIGDLFFGKAMIKDIITTVSEHKTQNLVGMGLADYGVITVDYLHKKFYFSPHADSQTFQEAPFFGFNAQLIDGLYTVSAVYKNTEAERLGLRNGYQITKINDFDLSDHQMNSICELVLSNYRESEIMKVNFVDDAGQNKAIEIKRDRGEI